MCLSRIIALCNDTHLLYIILCKSMYEYDYELPFDFQEMEGGLSGGNIFFSVFESQNFCWHNKQGQIILFA